MKRVSPGDKILIRADDWNAALDAGQAFRHNKLGGGAGIPDTVAEIRFRNDASSMLPWYGLGWITDTVIDDLAVVKQAAYPGVSRIVIASQPCDPGANGAGWTEGLHPVRVTDWAGILVGDRIGGQKDSWDAMKDPLGPLTVIGKLESPLVMALITGRRGDHKECVCGNTAPSGPYQVILFAAGHSVSEDSPGNLTVSST